MFLTAVTLHCMKFITTPPPPQHTHTHILTAGHVLLPHNTGVAAAVLSWIGASFSVPLAVALGLNWGLRQLTPGKTALLAGLAFTERLWMYWAWEAGRAADGVLARHAPGLRHTAWALFVAWIAYALLSPAHWPALPFWPFAPGSRGIAEALI